MAWQDDPLIEKTQKWESDALISAAKAGPPSTPAKQSIELRAGISPPKVLTESANPYSAGFFLLGRQYSVGDRATFRQSDMLTKIVQPEYAKRVTRVDVENDRVEINGGSEVWDTMGNYLKIRSDHFQTPGQFYPAELHVGKKWRTTYKVLGQWGLRTDDFAFHISRREMVRVPAGEFFAFRVTGVGWLDYREYPSSRCNVDDTFWLVPSLNFVIKHERVIRYTANGKYYQSDNIELVYLRQHAFST